MECTITITYRWWRGDGKPIWKGHERALRETAEVHIGEMMAQGLLSGGLSDNIHTTRRDISYTGWWEAQKL